LPPQLNQASGKWAAFIHPGMGASFAGDEGLEMPPPEAGQVALLEGLESATPAQFAHALARLRPQGRAAEGLLLRDATLEDIVKHLHSKNIEPTFRFLK
jgi:NADPH-dependent ferric siderophore reductase